MSQEEKPGLAAYHARMRAAVRWSAAIALVAAALSAAWFPLPALALAVGGLCGILNAVLTSRGRSGSSGPAARGASS